MAETKIYIDDNIDKQLREEAMQRFGYGRGSISRAAEEAVIQWLMKQDVIKNRISKAVDLAKNDPDVIALIIFGSYARKEGRYRDIDMAVVLSSRRNSFDELVKYSNAVLSDDDRMFDVSILNDLPVEMQRRALNDANVVYAKDKSGLYDYSINLMRNTDIAYA